MGNNQLSQNENILVLLDQQNIVHIDPNTVVSADGITQPRLVDHENLVMYVNLEADLVPRSVLYSESDTNTLTSIAEGSFNLLRNQSDKNSFENNFDTNWTETFVSNSNIGKNRTTGEKTNYDPSAQTFGIDTINITVKGANNIPQVSINFIDVRGKTLFDSPDNSPYKAFFHQPWPIFYLTVKGFYGKAVRYRLQLVDFKSKFNGNTGNFEITTKFVGSSYAFLNDILLQNIINAPFMYMVETAEPYRLNEQKGFIEKKISKSTKGYAILKSVYDEYKSKGYIDKTFPVKTLRDLLMTATSLETVIEKSLFSEIIEPEVLSDVAQYDKQLDQFEKTIDQWGIRYLNSSDVVSEEKISVAGFEEPITVKFYNLNKITSDKTKTTSGPISLDIVTGTTNSDSLIYKINFFITALEKNSAFGTGAKTNPKVKTQPISLDKLKNINDFYQVSGSKIGVSVEKIINTLKEVQSVFIKKRSQVEDVIEAQMNKIIEDPKMGFGFKPTIRNIFAVILANADTYIRLMKDVHTTAVRRSDLRKKEIKYSSDNEKEVIYPWPEVKKNNIKDGKPTFYYPGDPDIIEKTKGNNYALWPEVEFVETYNSVAVKRIDPGTNKEISPSDILFVFDGNDETSETFSVNTALNLAELSPYTNKSLSNFIYEIYERAQLITSYETFTYGDGLNEISKAEFNNISGATINDIDIKSTLSNLVKTNKDLLDALYNFSPRERWPYYQDRASTVDYIKNIIDQDFKIESYSDIKVSKGTKDVDYDKLQSAIDSYEISEYRLNEFPFSTDLYTKYVGDKKLTKADYKYVNVLKVNQNGNFISSPINAKAWVQDGFDKNIFTNQINYSGFTRNLLNTPYFHKQLYSDFIKGGIESRYVGSAYILLNSLPFKDLDDKIDFGTGSSILMSSLLKEIGATHYIPHHLMLKWGAIYHRYKRYLVDGVDILSGVTTPISGSTFFDNGRNIVFNLSGGTTTSTLTGVTYNSNMYVGIYPYYHGIYSQIVNGYSFYNPSGLTKTESNIFAGLASTLSSVNDYNNAVTSGITRFVASKPTTSSGSTLTCLVDNSKFTVKDNRYTILPSYNGSQINNIVDNFTNLTQDSFRIIYDSNNLNNNPQYSVAYFPGYGEKFENISGVYSLDGVKKKVVDLIAVFSPKMLDEFEKRFIEFSSLDLDIDTSVGGASQYDSFQGLLKEISSVDKEGIDFTKDGYEVKIKENQKKKLEKITIDLLSNDNLDRISIGNPKQIDNYVLYGYIGKSKTYSVNAYNPIQLTQANRRLIELHIGQNITGQTYNNISLNLYEHFFQVSNLEISPENIYAHRELARIYAGWVKSNAGPTFVPNYTNFKQYLTTNIFNQQVTRLNDFLNNLTKRFSDLEAKETPKNNVTIYHGYNEAKTTLLDTYQYFKSFNDKWVAGNALGQRSLMEEFLFLDRANKDIGDEAYISLDRLISLSDEKNVKIDLYSAVSLLIQGTNFDLRPLPSYINFYGTNSTNKKKVIPSKNLARTLFGTHLDVDYEESSPKIILQYINKTSQYLDMTRVSKEYKFKNDGFDIKDPNNNPLLIEPKIFMDADLSKSNRVVSFEINFGDQAQNIFKNISLDQSTYKNTTESALAQERLARSQGGGGSHSVDIGLFDIYKTASYQCTVSCMGNAMIQPTMYFYLANVPMFAGTYLVFDVSHSIKQGGFETSFTGVRISNSSLPSLDNSFMSSYRPLFSRLLSSAVKKKQEKDQATTTSQTITTKDNKTITIEPGTALPGEDLPNLLVRQSGYLFGDLIPYNGQLINNKPENYIQLIDFQGKQWLRTRVCVLGSGKYTPLKDGKPVDLTLVSGWKAYPNKLVKLSDINQLNEAYSIRANVTNQNREKLFGYNATFYNPKTGKSHELKTDVNPNAGLFDGPVHNGPSIDDPTYGKFGIALSSILMRKLKLAEGDVIYVSYDKK